MTSESEWVRELVLRLARAVAWQYANKESTKMSRLNDEVVTDKFSIGNKNKLYFSIKEKTTSFSYWKGSYCIEETLDKNTFIVSNPLQY